MSLITPTIKPKINQKWVLITRPEVTITVVDYNADKDIVSFIYDRDSWFEEISCSKFIGMFKLSTKNKYSPENIGKDYCHIIEKVVMKLDSYHPSNRAVILKNNNDIKWAIPEEIFENMWEPVKIAGLNYNNLIEDDYSSTKSIQRNKMTKEEFSKVMDAVIVQMQSFREAGQKEYARTEDNAFANFERVAERLKISREKVLMVYLEKHLDGIHSYIDGHTSQRENVRGRIMDSIVYLTLLYGMVEESNEKTEKDYQINYKD